MEVKMNWNLIRILLCGSRDEQIQRLKNEIDQITITKDKLRLMLSSQTKDTNQCRAQVDVLNSTIAKCNNEIQNLTLQIFKLDNKELKAAAEKWDSRHTIKALTYKGRFLGKDATDKIAVPLQLFITPHDPVIKSDIEKYHLQVKDPLKCDAEIFKIYKFTRNNPSNPYRYAYDSTVIGVPEFWMFPFELRHAKRADCEDFSHELVSYLIAAGVPSFRVRAVCGNVRGYNGAGHSTVYVLDDNLETFFHLNSTTPPSMLKATKLSDLPTSNDEKDLIGIKNVWFSFNNLFCWNDFEGTQEDLSKINKIINFD